MATEARRGSGERGPEIDDHPRQNRGYSLTHAHFIGGIGRYVRSLLVALWEPDVNRQGNGGLRPWTKQVAAIVLFTFGLQWLPPGPWQPIARAAEPPAQQKRQDLWPTNLPDVLYGRSPYGRPHSGRQRPQDGWLMNLSDSLEASVESQQLRKSYHLLLHGLQVFGGCWRSPTHVCAVRSSIKRKSRGHCSLTDQAKGLSGVGFRIEPDVGCSGPGTVVPLATPPCPKPKRIQGSDQQGHARLQDAEVARIPALGAVHNGPPRCTEVPF